MVTNVTAHAEATTRQMDYLRSLNTERVVPALYQPEILAALDGTRPATKETVSRWISVLVSAARKPRVAPAADDALVVALAAAVPSMYAVPTEGLHLIPGLTVTGDLLFLEVRPWKGKNYLNRLHGAPGAFTRTRFNRSQQLALLSVIAGKHQEYARLFGEKYTCCGRCAAPLTDQRSRELYLGPTCAGYFGVKF